MKVQTHITWHSAFIEAIKLTLAEYQDTLDIIPEFQLSLEPLKIDCVIIKKVKDMEISNAIASHFRGVNILEYKSPEDYVSVADYYKVNAYACFYVYLKKIPFQDLTLSFIESRHPRVLLRHLKIDRGFKVAENTPGVYTVVDSNPPMQIINSRKLPPEDFLWLRGLNKRLGREEAQALTDQILKQGKGNKPESYLNVIYRANRHLFEEESIVTADEYLEKVEPYYRKMAEVEAKAAAKATAIALAKGRAEVLSLLEQGLTVEEIKQTLAEQVEASTT